MKPLAVIGMGNAGSQVASRIGSEYSSLVDTITINSAESDLAMISDACYKIKIGGELAEGSGRDREKAKKYLQTSIIDIANDQKIIDILKDKKYVFIVSSASGGTGSGTAPLFYTALHGALFKIDAKIILVGILPDNNAGITDIGNALSYMKEVYSSNMPASTTYMLYDNGQSDKTDITDRENDVNNAIVKHIMLFSRLDFYHAEHNNIDDADLLNMVNVPGRMIIFGIDGKFSENDLESRSIEARLISANKSGMHAEIERDGVINTFGLISYLPADTKGYLHNYMPDLVKYIGEPVTSFYHIAVNDTDDRSMVYVVCTGLSKARARIDKLTARLEECAARVKQQADLQIDPAHIKMVKDMRKRPSDSDQNLADVFSGFMNSDEE
jgi:hypothetical protein